MKTLRLIGYMLADGVQLFRESWTDGKSRRRAGSPASSPEATPSRPPRKGWA
jgi:hypothetical protein